MYSKPVAASNPQPVVDGHKIWQYDSCLPGYLSAVSHLCVVKHNMAKQLKASRIAWAFVRQTLIEGAVLAHQYVLCTQRVHSKRTAHIDQMAGYIAMAQCHMQNNAIGVWRTQHMVYLRFN